MKKQLFQKIFLIMLPLLAVALASTKDSVTVAYTLTGLTEYYSYFDMIPVTQMQILPPLAAILCLLTGMVAVIYVAAKKTGCLKAMKILTFAATTIAVAPILLRGEVLVVPHVGVPLLMTVEYLLVLAVTPKESDRETAGKIVQLKKH